MIRKWLKFHTSFIDLLKNSTANKTYDQKWLPESPFRHYGSCSSLYTGQSLPLTSTTIKFVKPLSDLKERGDGPFPDLPSSQECEKVVAKTPAKTELFQIKGPNGSAFLIEVQAKDLNEIKAELVRLKGDYFEFDKTIVEYFNIRCMFSAEPQIKSKDQLRLAKIHAISSGSEEVHQLGNDGQFLFVLAVDRTMRAKRILEKLGYKICGILYQFQPKEKVQLEDHLLKICNDFVRDVEQIPKVISVTHNL